MFKPKKAQDPIEELQDRVAYLEGVNAILLQYLSNRGHIVRGVREGLQPGTIERGLMDLMITVERDAFGKAYATEVNDAQQSGHDSFVTIMSRALRS